MKKEKIVFGVLLMNIVFLSGCSQKHILVQSIAPAPLEKAMEYQRLSIIPMQKDTFGITSYLQERLVDKKFHENPVFEIVLYEPILALRPEEKQTGKASSMKNVEAFLTLEADAPTVYDTPYFIERIHCVDAKCKNFYTYLLPCVERDYTVATTFKMIDAKNATLVLSKNLLENRHYRTCYDASYSPLPRTDDLLKNMQETLVERFIALISPTYYAIYARIAETEPEFELSEDAQTWLKNGMNALKESRMAQAQEYFEKVLSLTEDKSYIATHNLGLVYESKGNFETANALYQRCFSLLKHPTQQLELVQSLNRIQQTLTKENCAKRQMKKSTLLK